MHIGNLMTASALGVLIAVTPARAQDSETSLDAPVAAPDDGGEIVVTARRVEERLGDVPLAITAISGGGLQQRGITQVMEIRQAVAGLNVVAAAGRPATPIYTIRGQRAAEVSVTQDPSVAIYVDEVIVMPANGGNLGLFDLASVQVLKGPQGTLFGRNTTGGAVLFTTQQPTARFEGYVKAGYGNYDARTLQAALNLPVADWLRLRIAGNYAKTDGFGKVVAAPAGSVPASIVQPAVGDRVRDTDEQSVRVTSLFMPSDAIEITTTGYYSRADTGGPGFRLLDPFNPAGLARQFLGPDADAAYARQQQLGDFDVESNVRPFTRTRIAGISNTAIFRLSDELTFKNIMGYRRLRYSEQNDSDGTALAILEASNVANFSQYSVETQLQGDFPEARLKFLVGTYLFDQKGLDFADGTMTFGAKSSIGGRVHNESRSIFGQVTYGLTDTLNLTGGLRYTTDTRKFVLENYTGSVAAPGLCNLADEAGVRLPIDDCRFPVSTQFSKPSWLVSLDQKIGDDTLAYVSHRRGYRSGGFALRAFNRATLAPFQPETVSDIEVGVKSKSRLAGDWTLNANLAAYYQWYKDVQRTQTVAVLVGGRTQAAAVVLNAAKAHIYGGEAEVELRHGNLLSIGANYAYVRPAYDDWPIRTTVGGVPDVATNFKDREFFGVSRHQLNGTVRLSPPVGERTQLNLTANLYYQSKQYLNDDIQNRAQLLATLSPEAAAVALPNLHFTIPAYALVNFRAELEDIGGSGLTVAAWVKNAFDKRYLAGGNVFYHNLGLGRYTYGDPRTYGVEATYRF